MSSDKENDGSNLKQVLNPSLYAKDVTISKDEMTRRLKKLSAVLADLKQKPSELKTLKAVAQCLTDRSLTKHKSKEIVLLTACCLSDILRIYAPHPPYDQNELKGIFELFLQELEGLAHPSSPNFPRYFHMLESLAIVNTCLILVEFENDGMLMRLFDLFFDLCKHDLSSRIEFHMLDILASCLSECETVSTKLLHTILRNLVNPLQTENPNAFNMAHKLILRCEGVLERPITSFIKENVISNNFDEEEWETDLPSGEQSLVLQQRANQLEVLYQLAAHAPAVLMTLMPDLSDMLLIDDEKVRSEIIHVFGRVFTHPTSSFASKNGPLLTNFLKRFNDVKFEVRVIMCEFGEKMLLNGSEKFRESVGDYLNIRVQDQHDKVRLAAVMAICNAAIANSESVSLSLLNTVGRRTMDKKNSVRDQSMEFMSKLFKKYCSDFWKHGKPLPKSAKKFSWIPRRIVASSNLDQSMMFMVERLVDKSLLDENYSAQERARCLSGIFASFDEKNRCLLLKIAIESKKSKQDLVMQLLAISEEIKHSDADTLRKKRLARIHELAKQFVKMNGDDKEDLNKLDQDITAVFSQKDKNIAKWLRVMCDPVSAYTDCRAAQVEFVKAMRAIDKSTKKLPKEQSLFYHLSNSLALTILNIDNLPFLFEDVKSNLEQDRAVLCISGLEMIRAFARSFPAALFGLESLKSMLDLSEQSKNDEVALMALEILSLLRPAEPPVSLAGSIQSLFNRLTIKGTPEQAGYIVLATAGLFNGQSNSSPNESRQQAKSTSGSINTPELFSSFLEKYCTDLKSSNKSLEMLLAAAGEIASVEPTVFEAFDATGKVVEFVTQVLVNDQKASLKAKLVGIQVLTKYLLALGKSNSPSLTPTASPFLKLMKVIIKSNGNLSGASTQGNKKRKSVTPKKNSSEGDEETEEKSEDNLLTDDEALLLEAAKSVILACSVPVISKFILSEGSKQVDTTNAKSFSDSLYMSLCLVAHNESAKVRNQFTDFVFQQLRFNKLPFTFSIILALSASSDKDKAQNYKTALRDLVSRERYKVFAKQTLGTLTTDEANKVQMGLPEYSLAYLIYMLSYHPDFNDGLQADDGDDDQPSQFTDSEVAGASRVYDYFMKFVQFFLEALTTGKEKDGNNFGLIMRITHTIKNCVDFRNPGNRNIYKLAELVQLSCRHLYQGKSWSETTMGNIFLPSMLYKACSTRPRVRYLPERYDPYPNEVTTAGVAPPSPSKKPVFRGTPSKKNIKKVVDTSMNGSTSKLSKAKSTEKPLKAKTPPTRVLPSRSSRGNTSVDLDDESFEKLLGDGDGEAASVADGNLSVDESEGFDQDESDMEKESYIEVPKRTTKESERKLPSPAISSGAKSPAKPTNGKRKKPAIVSEEKIDAEEEVLTASKAAFRTKRRR